MLNLDEGITVLSLFDGMACGRIALERAGIKVKAYYASEIDKPAMKVAKHNWPDIIHIGDVTKVFYFEGWLYTENGDFYVGKIDLLIGGSPCQGFSFAGKQLNFEDPRSKLFFEYVRLREETQCEYFFLENVVMKQEFQDTISQFLKTQPIFINSRLVSAQDRKRLYWTNIPYAGLPIDRKISWKDITETPGSFAGSMRGRRIKNGKRADYDKSIPIVQQIECRMDDKTNCLTTVGKDNVVVFEKVSRRPATESNYRYLTKLELERLQTLPDNYTSTVSYSKTNDMCGNGWTVDVIAHLFEPLKYDVI